MFERYGISREYEELDRRVMEKCAGIFRTLERTRDECQLRVLKAFTDNRVGLQHLGSSTGYGYGDGGKEMLDRVFADAVGAEDALCRPSILSGTHAITVALFGLLRSGDRLVTVTGKPYDTVLPVIGLEGEGLGSLKDFGVSYDYLPLKDGKVDLEAVAEAAKTAKVLHFQRSRGYDPRPAFSIEEIRRTAEAARAANPDVVLFVDNCYGEFCETEEPVSAGADLMAGSLIKNPGGGIAPTGGYVAGRADLVEQVANRLTAPGTGRELGSAPGGLRDYFLGLYFAPTVTCEARKSAAYAACLFGELGYRCVPSWDVPGDDIVTSIYFGEPEKLIALCEEVQAGSPVDSYAVPVPDDMPGYADKVIMAAGAFTQGSSIELSCDAPLREPYVAYLQGGLNLVSSRAALLKAAMRVGKA